MTGKVKLRTCSLKNKQNDKPFIKTLPVKAECSIKELAATCKKEWNKTYSNIIYKNKMEERPSHKIDVINSYRKS